MADERKVLAHSAEQIDEAVEKVLDGTVATKTDLQKKADTSSVNAALAEISGQLPGKADIGAPEVYDLPLSGDWRKDYSYSLAGYSKDEFGFVHLHIDIIIDTPITDGSDVLIANLPEGFRPIQHVYTACFDNSGDVPLSLVVRIDGALYVRRLVDKNWRTVKASIVFPAS